jgi:dipeptidyl aminopeptidase/acylaminoacyl peptidase
MRIHPLFIATLIPATALAQKSASSDVLRPITFLDRQYQRDVGSPTPSPDGKWLLCTPSTPDWNQARRQTDIYLVSVKDGLASTKQMTYTKDKNETSPRWSRDGKLFVFLSNRDAPSAPSGGSAAAGGGSAAGADTLDNRFKAISTGAGTSNWISMYAESDVQRNRQFCLGNRLPYDDFDAYWNQSPLKYIENARTPTMIHVVEGDPRVPRPQSEELFMALERLGVPTELYVYPGNTHGIPDPRNQLLKSVAEMAWMDYWVTRSGKRFAWREVLKTLDPEGSVATATAPSN